MTSSRSSEFEWAELRYAEMWRTFHDIEAKLTAMVEQMEARELAGEPVDDLRAEVTRLMQLYTPAHERMVAAHREMKVAQELLEASLPPPPEPERSPEDRKAWIKLLFAQEGEAWRRVSAAKAELDALPRPNLDAIVAAEGDSAAFLRALDEEMPFVDKRIDALVRMGDAQQDLERAEAAIKRMEPIADDEWD